MPTTLTETHGSIACATPQATQSATPQATLSATLLAMSAVVADLGDTAAAFACLDDTALIAAAEAVGDLAHCADRYGALAAAEIARRSRFELGYQGMAQNAGFVNTVAMVQSLTGVGKQEALRLIETGTLLAEAEAAETARSAIIDLEALRSDSSLVNSDSSPLDPDARPLDPDSGDAGPSGQPVVVVPEWRARLGRALTGGVVSVEAGDAIRRVLSDITDPAAGGDAQALDTALTAAVDELRISAPGLTPEQVFRRARQLRDVIDIAGIERREKQQHDLRSVRTWWDATGMHCGSWRLAPEDGVLVAEAFGQILSPRRGGPRFVDTAAKAAAQDLVNDVRSDEQIAADALVAMIKLASDADPGTMFGRRRPAVRVIVTTDQLRANRSPTAPGSPHKPGSSTAPGFATAPGLNTAPVLLAAPELHTAPGVPTSPGLPADPNRPAGSSSTPTPPVPDTAPPHDGREPCTDDTPPPDLRHGFLEGRPDLVSGSTIDRYLCDTGTISIGFDSDGQCMNVGRDSRLFTERQRLALTVRDGGCRFPGCDRPPSWCEAHHINPWAAAKGRTDIADGILLCRRHHMLLHNNNWTITRTAADYHLTPPRDIDPQQRPIPMPSRSPITHELARRRAPV